MTRKYRPDTLSAWPPDSWRHDDEPTDRIVLNACAVERTATPGEWTSDITREAWEETHAAVAFHFDEPTEPATPIALELATCDHPAVLIAQRVAGAVALLALGALVHFLIAGR